MSAYNATRCRSSAPRTAASGIDIASGLKQPVHDCFYLAPAEREAAASVSADEKLLTAGKRVKGVEVLAL